MTSSNPRYFPKVPIPDIITLEVRASKYKFGVGGHSRNDARNIMVLNHLGGRRLLSL